MRVVVLAVMLSAGLTPAMAAQYVASGDWAPTRQAACDQATALAMARTSAPVVSSSCLCDKGDKRYSCLATIDVADPQAVLAQEGEAALAKPSATRAAE